MVSPTAKMKPELGWMPGLMMDFTTKDANGEAWDFNKSKQRRQALRIFKEQKPMLLISRPMLIAFSSWQYINDNK